jgi:CopG family transcriptional regulator/antitoxin EndoAI
LTKCFYWEHTLLITAESGKIKIGNYALEVPSLSDSNKRKIVIELPQQLLNEVDGVIKQENVKRDELIYQATKMYLRERKQRFIRESMRQGYMEMAKINLNIASEAFLAEEEAENTLDHRLVSGV